MKIFVALDSMGDIHITDNEDELPKCIVRKYEHEFPGKRKIHIILQKLMNEDGVICEELWST